MKFPWSHSSIEEILKNDGKFEHEVAQVTKDIISKKLEIVELVEELGPALTSTDRELRAKGTKLLSDVLIKIPRDFLNEKQLTFIGAFYCDRLKDHHSVIPGVLAGLLALLKMQRLPWEVVPKLFTSLFQNAPAQSQVREDRTTIFELFQLATERFSTELVKMGPDWVYGVIQSVEGERDPRNLMFLFKFMPKFIAVFPLGHLDEEMFEVFACYFPIDFHPSPKDPSAITRDLLAENLAVCLCSSKEFTDPCVELALEKLDSDYQAAKLDSLELIGRCAREFGAEAMEKHFDKIWRSLKMEVLPGPGKEVTQAALNAIEEIVRAVSKKESSLNLVLTTIFTSIIAPLTEIGSKLFISAANIALKCEKASPEAAVFTANKLLHIFVVQMNVEDDKTTAEERCALLELLTKALLGCQEQGVIPQLEHGLVASAEATLVKSLFNPELLKVSLNGVKSLAGLISDEHRYTIYTLLSKGLSGPDAKDFNDCLLAFAQKYPEEVMTIVVKPALDKDYETTIEQLLNGFSGLIFLDFFSDAMIDFLLAKILSSNETIQLEALKSLVVQLEEEEKSAKLIPALYEKHKVIERLVEHVKANPTFSSDILYQISIIIRLIVKRLDVEEQRKLVETYLPSMNLHLAAHLYLTSGLLGFLDAKVPLEDHFETLVTDLTQLSLSTEHPELQQLANHLICSLFNRMPDDKRHKGVLSKILKLLKEEIKKHNKQAVEILSWIAKSLLARGFSDAADVIESLAELLDHPTLGRAAAFAFEVISVEFPQLHLPLVKHLFKQKLFVLVMKKLEREVQDYSVHHLTALAFVLKIAPHQLLKVEIEKVGPILFRCLDLESQKPVQVALDITRHFLEEKNDYFTQHVQTLIPKLLKLTQFKDAMKIRIKALECLEALTSLPPFLLMPFRHDVTLGLSPALDDPKRLVRTTAVSARMRWYLIGEDTATDEKP